MKLVKKIFITALTFTTMQSYAQNRSVQFIDGTMANAIEKAQKEKKMIFIDCYTSWCGPCKWMASNVFTQDPVADYFNSKFINIKIDCEKGEGPEVAKKYGVSGYPTFVIINPKGEVLHKIVGASEGEPFIAKVEKGLNSETSLINLQKRFEKGEKSIDFLMTLFGESVAINDHKGATLVAERIIENSEKESLLDAKMWSVVSYYGVAGYGKPMWNFILDNSEQLSANVGAEKVSEKIGNTLHPYIFGFFTGNRKTNNTKEDFTTYNSLIEKYKPKNEDILISFMRLAQSRTFDDFDGFFNCVIDVYKTMNIGEHYRVMHNIIDYLAEKTNADQKKILIQTLKASEELQNEYMAANYTKFYDKLGYENVAVKFQKIPFEQALEKSQKENKLIFLDAYTKWCGPCKYMTDSVFSKKEAGDFFNANFINVKYDMESELGKELNKRLNVTAYPTFLLIRGDGKVQHTLIGGDDVAPFIASVKEGMNVETSLLYLKEQYAAGKLDREKKVRLFDLASSAKEAELAETIKTDLLKGVSDKEKTEKVFWPILTERRKSYYGTENFDFILKNVDALKINVGKESVENFIFKNYEGVLAPWVQGNFGGGTNTLDKKLTMEIRKQLPRAKLSKENRETILAKCDFAEARRDGAIERMVKILKKNHPFFVYDNYWSVASSFLMAADGRELTTKETEAIQELAELFAAKVEGEKAKEEVRSYFTKVSRRKK